MTKMKQASNFSGAENSGPGHCDAQASCGIYQTLIGELTIAESGGMVTAVLFGDRSKEYLHIQKTALTDDTAKQLAEYFAGKRQSFDIPFSPRGTAFQQLVWQKLQMIPYGETRSYGQIAKSLGKPGASRAVGMANNRNPILILIPCHRVIGADGSLVGFGAGLKVKKMLLELEKRSRREQQ